MTENKHQVAGAEAEIVHISSAVVRALPHRAEEARRLIEAVPGVEVFGCEGGRIVVVLEGPSSAALGARLAEIALIDGVISASLVYEQVEALEPVGEAR
jgi:periplasmic nitrate reductase NapD